MRLRMPALAVVALATLAWPFAGGHVAAQSPPAQAGAGAAVAAGDLGTVGRVAVQDSGRDVVSDAVSRPGM